MQKLVKTTMLLVGGALASYAVNLVLSPKERKKSQAQVKRFMRQVDWDAVSQRVFGQSSQEMRQQLEEVVTLFQEKVGRLRGGVENVNGKEYEQLVDDFAKKLEDDKDFTKAQIKKLSDYLRSDFKTLKAG
jgi:menaquinone-dependent protoporphyrinogen IX oxidase